MIRQSIYSNYQNENINPNYTFDKLKDIQDNCENCQNTNNNNNNDCKQDNVLCDRTILSTNTQNVSFNLESAVSLNASQRILQNEDYVKNNQDLEDSIAKINLLARQRKQARSNACEENLIEQFKSLSASFNNAQQRILELEETLKQESQSGEEQRHQIEILKKVVESKVEADGLKEFFAEVAQESSMNSLDLFVEIQNIKMLLDQQTVEQQQNAFRIRELEDQICEIQGDNEILKKEKIENKQKIETLEKDQTTIQEKNSDLQQENESLIDEKNRLFMLVEELRSTCEQMKKEALERESKIKGLEDKFEQAEILKIDIKEKESENTSLRNANEEVQNELSEIRNKIKEQILKNDQVQKQTEETIANLIKKHEGELKNQKIEHESEMEIVRRENEIIEKELNREMRQKEELKRKIEEMEIIKKIESINDQKMQTRENNLMATLRCLEDKVFQLEKEKTVYKELVQKQKPYLANTEIANLLEEICVNTEKLTALEKEKEDIRKKFDELYMKNKLKEDKQNKRKMEEYKDYQNELENNIKVQKSKLQTLDSELQKMENLEKQRQQRVQQLEKSQNHLKNDITFLKNEIDLKEISNKKLESAYSILLTDYKRITQESKISTNSKSKEQISSTTIKRSPSFNGYGSYQQNSARVRSTVMSDNFFSDFHQE